MARRKRREARLNGLLKCVSLALSHDMRTQDIYGVYKAIGAEALGSLLRVVGGRTVTFPTLDAFDDAVRLAMCFYCHEVARMTWEETHRALPFGFSSLSMSRRIGRLSETMRGELMGAFGGDARDGG